jgi:hypothetical protein
MFDSCQLLIPINVTNFYSCSGSLPAAFQQVPPNFPRPNIRTIGLQPLFSAVAFEGRYFPPGCTPPEIFERWNMFEEAANELAEKAYADDISLCSGMSKAEILLNYLGQLYLANCFSQKELLWLGRRAASLIGCEIPNGRFYGLKEEGFRVDCYPSYQLRTHEIMCSRSLTRPATHSDQQTFERKKTP